ncbi:MAG: sigma-54-dependent Fis family transcriptional regulator [Comamonadaceae bacterium]|nr:sigma-54-dependent Fis family transcriptional regulator [Comamonadaceae bacterium]
MKANSNALGPEVLKARFSQNVMSAWEDFMTFNQIKKPLVRDVVLSSWQRCREAQVSPTVSKAPLPTTRVNIEHLLEQHSNLLRATYDVSKMLSSTFETSRSVLLVTDSQGIILETYGDRATREAGEERHISSGGCWSEQMSGTNAIGTAIVVGGPVQIHALEHYCEGVKEWTCSAALIHGPGNTDILGVVDISGFDKTFNTHSLALAISIGSQIEATLAGWAAYDQIALLQWCNEKASSWKTDGLIVLDHRGCVINANDKSHEILQDLGIKVNLARGNRLMDINQMNPHGVSTSGVDWISEDWIQPAVIDGKKLGTLIVIPHRGPSPKGGVERPTNISSAQGDPAATDRAFDRIISNSEVMCSAIDRAKRLAMAICPVLILGETGVGKEEFALAIHKASGVSKGPFVALNCGALVKDLVASELFGYSEGAFTGARRGGRAGKFEEANGGTLFLDEIGELPLDIQAHLLRVLQDGTVIRMGDNRERKVSVRILSATHRDLRVDIANGRFREDLYYRIAITTLVIPPLRARTNDIEPLVEYFLKLLFLQYGGRKKYLSAELIETLKAYPWPGNIRQMKNAIESMWHLTESDMLELKDIPYEHVAQMRMMMNADTHLRTTEREAIIVAINSTGGNMRKTAHQLGIARSTLYQKVKTYGISKTSSTD